MSQNFSHQDSSQEETNDGGNYYTPSRMPDLLGRDHEEEDCNSDNPGLPPGRVVATATYLSVKGRALWCQRLPRQVTGCHRCGRSEVECEEGWGQPCRPFSLVNLVLYIRRAIPASGSLAYTARLEFHTWHSFCGNIY
jgi:hypothetical protein